MRINSYSTYFRLSDYFHLQLMLIETIDSMPYVWMMKRMEMYSGQVSSFQALFQHGARTRQQTAD